MLDHIQLPYSLGFNIAFKPASFGVSIVDIVTLLLILLKLGRTGTHAANTKNYND